MRLAALPPVALIVLLSGVPSAVFGGQAGARSAGAHLPQRAGTPPAVDRLWPDPPAPARIRFVRAFTPQVAPRPSLFSTLWRLISGAADRPVMAQPYGVTVGPRGRLYVTDAAGEAVHVYELRTGRYSRITVGGAALIGVAAVADRLFITDSVGGRVIALDGRGRRAWTVGKAAGFARPTGIVAAGDRLHVVDTLAHQIVTLSTAGQVLGRFGSRGIEPGQFNFPTHISRDARGQLFVTDSMNFRVQIFSPDGRYRSSFGKIGDGSGDFNRPKGVAVDSEGHVYVVEGFHDVVQIFDQDGQFLLAFGEPGHQEGEFWLAAGIAIHNDRIYVADSANRRVQEFEYLKEQP